MALDTLIRLPIVSEDVFRYNYTRWLSGGGRWNSVK